MSVLARFATPEPTVCAVCHRHAVWIGYRPKHRGPIIWLCDDNSCHAAAQKVYGIAQGALDAYEAGAALEAGANAGSYLDEIGKNDLVSLTAEEWHEFLRRVVVGFEHALRRMILQNEPPF
jgi:hypothetical protein